MVLKSEDVDPTASTCTERGGGGGGTGSLITTPVSIGGSYEVVRLIGRGGMGVVYEARHVRLGKRVALKVLRTADATAEQLRRFDREARALAALSHPNIAQVFDAGIHTVGMMPIPYCVMELLDAAVSLVAYAKAHQLGLIDRLRLVIDACDALHTAHEAGIVHRDVKPSNLLVTPVGQVKVIDFGAAAITSPEGTGGPLTVASEAGSLMGTLAYMSPEQFDGDTAAVDRRADVYAIGVTLFELLCGQRPYELPARDLAAAERIVRETDPPKPRTLNPLISRSLEAVMLAALQKNPERRYETTRALADDLRRAIDERPVVARTETVAQAAVRRARRSVKARPRLAVWSLALLSTSIGVWLGNTLDHSGAARRFDRFAAAYFDHVPDLDPARRVQIVAATDQTDFAAIAKSHALPTVLASNPRSRRPVFGLLLERLAVAGPSVVALDVRFEGASEFDGPLVGGAQALRSAGVPLVLAARSYDLDSADRNTGIGRQLLAAASFCAPTTGQIQRGYPLLLDLAAQRGAGDPQLSFALTTALAYWGWKDTSAIIPDSGVQSKLVPDHVIVAEPAGAERAVRVSTLNPLSVDRRATGLLSNDMVAFYVVEMPRESSSIDQATTALHDLFTLSDEQLRERFRGKVVLIGDMTKGADGPHGYEGRHVYGIQVQSAALRQLLEDRSLKHLPLIRFGIFGVDGRFMVMVLAAVITLVFTRLLPPSAYVGLLIVAGSWIVILGTSWLAYTAGGWLLSPTPALVIVLVTGIGMILARRSVASLVEGR